MNDKDSFGIINKFFYNLSRALYIFVMQGMALLPIGVRFVISDWFKSIIGYDSIIGIGIGF